MSNKTEGVEQASWLQDYHLHTAVTVDGRMNEIEACERASLCDVKEIAFTNHVMLNQPGYRMSAESLIRHWQMIQACEHKFPMLQIRLGLEMDYYPGRETDIAQAIKDYEQIIDRHFDIILGSVHEINGSFFSNQRAAEAFFPGRDLLTAYHEYFKLATMAAQSQLFDIMAHPDLIKKYTGQLTRTVPFDEYRSAIEPFINALIENQVGIELNTKGLKLPVSEMYPSRQFLEMYLEKARTSGIEPIITTGSDAHKLEDVGFGIKNARELLKDYQVCAITSFINRNKVPRSI